MVRRLGNGLRSFETLVTAIVGLIALPDPTMFDLPLAGTLGNEPRNFLRGPDLKNVDFAINKDTKAGVLGEQGIVQFRTEFFNILNRPISQIRMPPSPHSVRPRRFSAVPNMLLRAVNLDHHRL